MWLLLTSLVLSYLTHFSFLSNMVWKTIWDEFYFIAECWCKQPDYSFTQHPTRIKLEDIEYEINSNRRNNIEKPYKKFNSIYLQSSVTGVTQRIQRRKNKKKHIWLNFHVMWNSSLKHPFLCADCTKPDFRRLKVNGHREKSVGHGENEHEKETFS